MVKSHVFILPLFLSESKRVNILFILCMSVGRGSSTLRLRGRIKVVERQPKATPKNLEAWVLVQSLLSAVAFHNSSKVSGCRLPQMCEVGSEQCLREARVSPALSTSSCVTRAGRLNLDSLSPDFLDGQHPVNSMSIYGAPTMCSTRC